MLITLNKLFIFMKNLDTKIDNSNLQITIIIKI